MIREDLNLRDKYDVNYQRNPLHNRAGVFSLSRLSRFTQDSDRQKKMPDMPLFKDGLATHRAGYMSHKQGVLTPLYTKCTQSRQDAKILYNKA